MPIVDDLEAFLHEHRFSPTSPPVLPFGDGHVLRSANRDGGHQSLPEFLDRLQVADEHPGRPVLEGHELLGQPPHILFDGEAAPAPPRPLPVLGEGVLPEELMLDVQGQVADPALHAESVVVTQQREVEQHHLGHRGNAPLGDERLAQGPEGGHQLGVQVPLGPQPFQEEPTRLVLLLAVRADLQPVLFAAYALPTLHGAVGRAGIPADLLGSLPVLLERGPELGVAVVRITERGLDVAPLSLSHHVCHREPPVLVGGARRAPVVGTMRGDAGADAGRGRHAWHSPAHLERIVCVACHPRASAGTSRGHAGARWRSGTGACRTAAIPAGGSLSWATDRRNSSPAPRPPRAAAGSCRKSLPPTTTARDRQSQKLVFCGTYEISLKFDTAHAVTAWRRGDLRRSGEGWTLPENGMLQNGGLVTIGAPASPTGGEGYKAPRPPPRILSPIGGEGRSSSRDAASATRR